MTASDLTAAEPLAASLVRLVAGGSLLGTGFVLPGDRVATCAHVVEGFDGVTAEFPLVDGSSSAVEVDSLDTDQDIAVLRLLDPPAGTRPAPVRLERSLLDHRFRVLGCTPAHPEGVWVSGVLAGTQGGNRVQMSVDAHHEQIVQGFSGAPVWDRELGGVVGMVVTRSGSNEATAHLLPIAVLREWVDSDHNPYRGLETFRESDADRFHGRDAEVAELLEVLERQRMVAISGPSGSGKSSLVRAGLIPRLRQAGTEVVEPGEDESLPTRGVLFLDQFEEEVVADRTAARAKLERIVQHIAEHPLRVVLTLRSRSLDELVTPDTAQQLGQAVWLLKPMRPEQLRQAIEVPAERAGLAFEAGLPEAIVHDCPPGQLALLSTVLDQLWQNRHGVWLTHEAYQELGRVTGALAHRADDVLDGLGTEGLRRARRLLTSLTRPDGDTGHVRRSVLWADLEPELRELASEFAGQRLVVVHDGRVELPHQALIDHWPTLRSWLDDDADFLAWQAKLHDLKNSGAQLTGPLLAEATTWVARRNSDVPESLRDYIHTAERTHRRTQRRWRTTTAVVSVLALVSAVLTGVVLTNNLELDGRLRQINAGRLVQEADRAGENNPSQALQLALAAWREDPDSAQAWGALFQQRLYWSGVDRLASHPSLVDVDEMVASSDGQVVAVKPRSADRDVTVWWGLFGPAPRHAEIPTNVDTLVALRQDGTMLATEDDEHGVRVWDLDHPEEPVISDPRIGAWELRFSANGRFLMAMDGENAAIVLWDLDDPTAPPVQHPWSDPTFDESYPGPDGRSLVTTEEVEAPDGYTEHVAVVRDLASGAELRRSPGAVISSFGLVDGGTKAAVCAGGALTIHDLFSGEVSGPYSTDPAVLVEPYSNYEECSFSVDASGQYLLFGSAVMRWRTGTWLSTDSTVPTVDTISGDPHTLVRDAGGPLDVIFLRNDAVQLRTVPTSPPLSPRRQVNSTTTARAPGGQLWATYVHGPSGTPEDPRAQIALIDAQGRILQHVPCPNYPHALAFDATGEHVIVVDGYDLRIYRTAGLVLEHEARLPAPGWEADEGRTVGEASVTSAPDGTLLISHRGLLSSWDPWTGVQTAPPLPLVDPGVHVVFGPEVVLRPGHDQVLVNHDGVEVWNLRARKRLHRFEIRTLEPPVVSPDGRVAAVADMDDTAISLFDLTTMEPLPPLTAVDQDPIGMMGDYLFARGESELYVWQWRERVQVTSLDLHNNWQPQSIEEDGFVLDDRPLHRELVPYDPQVWFDDLCRISDREYTPQEKALLERLGVDDTPPCR